MKRITSMKNPLIQQARSATVDAESTRVLLQDWAACRWALDAGLRLEHIFVSDDSSQKAEIERTLKEKEIRYYVVTPGIIQKIKQTKYSSPVVAVCDPSSLIKPPSGSLVLILDQLQDPGNIGTIIRSARAFGVSHCVFVGKSALFHKKTISASRGHVFTGSCQVFETADEAADYCRQAGYTVAFTTMNADMTLSEASSRIKGPLALAFGNEAQGCDEHWASCADTSISIPMNTQVESLNVAVTAGLCCYLLASPIGS